MNVPIVGQPVTVLATYLTTLLRCNCDPDPQNMAIIILVGYRAPATCPRCQRTYVVQGLDEKQQVVIGLVTQQPVGVQ